MACPTVRPSRSGWIAFPDTKAVGAITAIFNPAAKAWTPVAEAGSVKVTGDASAVPDVSAALQSFVPASFFAVTVN
jgi:hypothetical protein